MVGVRVWASKTADGFMRYTHTPIWNIHVRLSLTYLKWLPTHSLSSAVGPTENAKFDDDSICRWLSLLRCCCFSLGWLNATEYDFVSIRLSAFSVSFGDLMAMRAHCIMRNFLVDLSCAFAQHQQPSAAAAAAERTTVTRNIKQRDDEPKGKKIVGEEHTKNTPYKRINEGWKKARVSPDIYLLANALTNHSSQDTYIFTHSIHRATVALCLWNFKRLYIKSLSIRYVRVIHFGSNKNASIHTHTHRHPSTANSSIVHLRKKKRPANRQSRFSTQSTTTRQLDEVINLVNCVPNAKKIRLRNEI